MKKLMKVFLIVLSVFMVCSCGKEKNNANSSPENDVFSLNYNGMNILLGQEFSRAKYGDELEYYETASCAFEDMDRTYTYEHYEISTYTLNGQENILSVYFLDENITTTEGVSIGDSKEKMLKTYGDKYEQMGNLYTYTKDKTLLEFIVENDIITSIEYTYAAES